MDLDEFKKVVYSEMIWCQENKSMVSDEFYRAYIAGLGQAVFLAERLETLEKCSLGGDIVEEPNEG